MSWIVAGVRTARSVSDQLLFKKILKFLHHLAEIDASKRYVFLRKLRNDATYKQKVGENLLLIMEKTDDMEKTEVIARCFSLFVSDYMCYEKYMALASLVCKATMAELKILRIEQHFDATKIEGGLASGVCEYEIYESSSDQIKLRQKLSKAGHELRLILLGRFEEEVQRRRETRQFMDKLFVR